METKQSKIELLIDEIQDYIDSCKFKALSNNIILVNKDEIDSYLMELKRNTPEEIKHYQKIIANRNAIIAEADKARNDAKVEAQEIVNKAINQTNELISEHEIMQRAYDQANEIINLAASQAQEIVDSAVVEANGVRDSATQYIDTLLAHVEEVCSHYINTSQSDYISLINGLSQCVETVKANRSELIPQVAEPVIPVTQNTAALKTDALADLELL